MMSTHLGECAKSSIYMPPDLALGMYREEHWAGAVSALLGGVVMRCPGIVWRGIAVLVGFNRHYRGDEADE